jgi:hypothetical protein
LELHYVKVLKKSARHLWLRKKLMCQQTLRKQGINATKVPKKR